MDIYALIASVSLTVQVIVFILLLLGYRFKLKGEYRKHGTAMLSAVVLHGITIFAVMVPSFVVALIPQYIVKNPTEIICVSKHSWIFRDCRICFRIMVGFCLAF